MKNVISFPVSFEVFERQLRLRIAEKTQVTPEELKLPIPVLKNKKI